MVFMKSKNQNGFILLIFMLALVLIAVLGLAYLRIKNAN